MLKQIDGGIDLAYEFFSLENKAMVSGAAGEISHGKWGLKVFMGIK